MLGRFSGSAMMHRIARSRLLSIFAGGSLPCLIVILLASGLPTILAIVLPGFFHSIMFPTIFALSIKDLGPYTKLGSSLLVMSIIGGAVCPLIMGTISDAWSIQACFRGFAGVSRFRPLFRRCRLSFRCFPPCG